MEISAKYVIIGSGPTGLGAAYRLQELGEKSFLILEKADHVGGLASSYMDEAGFTWDIGGHVHFSHYPYFDAALNKILPADHWSTFERESWIWIHDRFVPYPFQFNIHSLPAALRWKCLWGVWKAWFQRSDKPARDFEEWILRTFGQAIAQEFMRPYNFKVWGYPLTDLSYQWIGERVSVVNPWRVTRNVIGRRDDVSWGPNATFRFPKKGGTGAVWDAFAATIDPTKIQTGADVVSIDPKTKTLTLNSGQVIHYDVLLSTMPLDLLTQKISLLSDDIVSAARRLKHSTSHIVGVGLKGQTPPKLASKCWMYFPERNCPFYRVTVFSNYGAHHTPDPKNYWSLLTETCETPVKAVDRATLVQQTIQGLVNTRFIASQDEVASTWMFTAEYGYPTPSVDRDSILKNVIPHLETLGIYSRGRFGAWRYEISNQDHSFMQGVEWANRVKNGLPEAIFRL